MLEASSASGVDEALSTRIQPTLGYSPFLGRGIPLLGLRPHGPQPALYRIAYKNKVAYACSEGEREKVLKSFDSGADKASQRRYKGLGEMNPVQLWETTMDPAKRTLLQVTIEDAAAADRTFDMLMGEAVPPRRRFIQTHARDVRNLDI